MSIDVTVLAVIAAAILVVIGVAVFARRGRGAPPAVSSAPAPPAARPSAPAPSDATIVAPMTGAADATIVAPMPSLIPPTTAPPAPSAEATVVDLRAAPPVPSAAATVVDVRVPPAAPVRSDAATLALPASPIAMLPAAPASIQGPRLTVTKGGSGTHELHRRAYTIGRSSAADIVITDASVSGRHAKLSPRGDGFAITDLGSTNGTTIDGQPVHGEVELHGGETILLGDCVLRYDDG